MIARVTLPPPLLLLLLLLLQCCRQVWGGHAQVSQRGRKQRMHRHCRHSGEACCQACVLLHDYCTLHASSRCSRMRQQQHSQSMQQ
jgi:hypothetical protein